VKEWTERNRRHEQEVEGVTEQGFDGLVVAFATVSQTPYGRKPCLKLKWLDLAHNLSPPGSDPDLAN
jgi:hypothetical protein